MARDIANFGSPENVKNILQTTLYYSRKKGREIREAFPLPTLDLNFLRVDGAVLETAPALLDFSRLSLGTDVVAELVKTFAIDVARFSERGLLVEPDADNIFLFSEDYTQSVWVIFNATLGTASGAAPDGGVMTKLVETATTGVHQIRQSVAVTAGVQYTFSKFVRAEGRTECRYQLPSSGFGASVKWDFDLSALTATQDTAGTNDNAGIEDIGGGIFRIFITAEATATVSVEILFIVLDDAGNDNYLGDITKGLGIWGSQDEIGSFPTSYIKTEGSAVNRAADDATVPVANFNFNPEEGTVFIEGKMDFEDFTSSRTLLMINDGTNSTTNRYIEFLAPTGSGINCVVSEGGVTQGFFNVPLTYGLPFKLAMRIQQNNFAVCIDGGTVQIDTSGTVPTTDITTLQLGTRGGTEMNGTILRAQYFNRALTDAQLIELTSATLAPSLDLQFTTALGKPTFLPPIIDFSRLSLGTDFVEASLNSFAIDAPRMSERGLLVEPTTTRLNPNPTDLSLSPWSPVSLTAESSAEIGPDGNTIQKLTEDTSSGQHVILLTVTGDPTEINTVQFIAKADERPRIKVQLDGDSSDAFSVRFDLVAGTSTITGSPSGLMTDTSRSITPIGNGFFLCSITGRPGSATGELRIIMTLDDGTDVVYQGDGISGLFLGFVNFTETSFPTSLILESPTSTGVVRAIDVASVPLSSFDFNPKEGTILIEGKLDVEDNNNARTLLIINDGTSSATNRYIEFIVPTGSGINCVVSEGGVTQGFINVSITYGQTFKLAMRIKRNNFGVCIDGGAVQTDTSGTVPTTDITTLQIGGRDNLQQANGTILAAQYFPFAFTDADLVKITS